MAIFKKRDTALCENYRPITVSAGYKLFAIILLKRLHIAGAEERIWPTQFAFRSKRGSTDAIFATRWMVDLTLADRDGTTLVLLALDWAKAFDSISPTPLLSALERFGISATFRRFIQAIYNHRTFNRLDASPQFMCSIWDFSRLPAFAVSFFHLDDRSVY